MAFDPSVYNAQRRNINSDYQAKSASNLYAQRLSQQRGERNIADMRQNFSRSLPGFQGGFAQRGLQGAGVRSGVYAQALQDYAAQNYRNIADQQNEIASSRDQFRMSQAQLDAARQQALADLQMRKRQEIAMAAAQLANVR